MRETQSLCTIAYCGSFKFFCAMVPMAFNVTDLVQHHNLHAKHSRQILVKLTVKRADETLHEQEIALRDTKPDETL